MLSNITILLMITVMAIFPSLAQAGGSIASGETKSGAITSPSFIDTWTFSGTAGERIIVGFMHTSTPATSPYWKEISLYPPGGGPAEAHVQQEPCARLEHQLLTSGTYTIVVQDWRLDDAFPYNISFVKLDDSLPVITPGEMKSGSLVPSSLKAYRLQGQTGERVVAGFAHTTTPFIAPYWKDIYLYPPGGGPAEAHVQQEPSARLDQQLQTTGQYYVLFQDWRLDDTYTYNVSMVKNDLNATPLAPGQTLSGSLVPGALKAYSFYGQAGERAMVAFAHTTTPTISPYWKNLWIYPPSGLAAEKSVQQEPCAQLDQQLQETGRYTIVLHDWRLDDTYDYNVTLVTNVGPTSSRKDPDGSLLVSGQTANGSFGLGDLDAYYFYGNSGERVIIGLAHTTTPSIAPYWKYIWLFPPSGGSAEAQVHQEPSAQMDHQLLESGLYTVLVHDDRLDSTFNYAVSLAKIPATLTPGIYNVRPTNGSSLVRLSGNLSWEAVAGATGYDLFLGTDTNQALPKIGHNLAAPSLPLPDLVRNQVYYWRVIARTPSGDVAGPYWWFSTFPPKILNLGFLYLLLQ